MDTTVEKMDLRSLNIADEKKAQLRELFPEVFTEGGKIDFDRLKLTLGESVDVGKERYAMNWAGKTDCFKTIQQSSVATLIPARDESVAFDSTDNIFIEGDSLEVLKLLQKSYFRRVKMIYIDPPYNTGNDFIYPDNYSESLDTYLRYTGQLDSEGRKFSTNTEADGRFHSRWLTMMYPRLYLARNLLRDDGVIFVSIDDHEQYNLHKLMDEVFGEEHFCAQFVWNTEGNTDNQYAIKVNHEYILAYYKNRVFADKAIGHVIDPNTRADSNLWKGFADNNVNKNNPENPPEIVELPSGFPCAEEELLYPKKEVDDKFFDITKREKYISDETKKTYHIEKLSGLPVKLDDMVVKDHRLVKPCRIYGGMANKQKLIDFIKNDCKPIDDEGSPLRFYVNANAAVRYHKQNESPQNILSVLRNMGTTERTRGYLKQFDITYDYPKPLALIEYLIKIGCEPKDGIVLDFFAGSGTTGEAVVNVNKTDHGRRQFICVQLPEECDVPDFKNIAGIAKERLRRVLNKLSGDGQQKLDIENGKPDYGFKVFTLSGSNFRPWDATPPKDTVELQKQLELHVKHIKEGSSPEDLFYELMLKSGYPLNTPVSKLSLAGKSVFSVADGLMLICLEESVTPELIKAMADRKPERVVCLDRSFSNNDQLKTNAVQTMRVNGVTSFRTV